MDQEFVCGKVENGGLSSISPERMKLDSMIGLFSLLWPVLALSSDWSDEKSWTMPVTLYHGTTKGQITRFSVEKSRIELVDEYWGPGIHLTPSKQLAWEYANANRNIGFDHDEMIADLQRVSPNAAEFMEALYQKGRGAWAEYGPERFSMPEDYSEVFSQWLGGIDPNTLADLAAYIIGSAEQPHGGDGFVDFFHPSTGMPSWIYNELDEIGIDSRKYRPKVYMVEVSAKNPIITSQESVVRLALSKGYDCVVYCGPRTVDNIPEVIVFDPDIIRIQHVFLEDEI
jgi:hypothetical protein